MSDPFDVEINAALPAGSNVLGSVSISSALPAGGNNIGSVNIGTIPSVGAQGNAWNAAAVAAAGASASIDTNGLAFISAFGNASAATTIQMQYSADNATWYNGGPSIALSAAGDFGLTVQSGARYIRLTSSAAATITASIEAKG